MMKRGMNVFSTYSRTEISRTNVNEIQIFISSYLMKGSLQSRYRKHLTQNKTKKQKEQEQTIL